MNISFAAGRARGAPLTWGQRDIWRAVEAASDNVLHLLVARQSDGDLGNSRGEEAWRSSVLEGVACPHAAADYARAVLGVRIMAA